MILRAKESQTTGNIWKTLDWKLVIASEGSPSKIVYHQHPKQFFSLNVWIPLFIKYEQQHCATHWNKTPQNLNSMIQELNLFVWLDFLYLLSLSLVCRALLFRLGKDRFLYAPSQFSVYLFLRPLLITLGYNWLFPVIRLPHLGGQGSLQNVWYMSGEAFLINMWKTYQQRYFLCPNKHNRFWWRCQKFRHQQVKISIPRGSWYRIAAHYSIHVRFLIKCHVL